MDMGVAVAVLGVIATFAGIAVTIALFILTSIKGDIQNLYRIKSAISAELSSHKTEAAREFVTYPRMDTALAQHNQTLTNSITRIEAELKVLPQLRDLITSLATRMNVTANQTGGIEQIRG